MDFFGRKIAVQATNATRVGGPGPVMKAPAIVFKYHEVCHICPRTSTQADAHKQTGLLQRGQEADQAARTLVAVDVHCICMLAYLAFLGARKGLVSEIFQTYRVKTAVCPGVVEGAHRTELYLLDLYFTQILLLW